MRKSALVTVLAAGTLSFSPALAQGVGGAGQAPMTGAVGQQLMEGPGTPLHVSPSVIAQIQQSLNQSGFDVGNVDGQWGPQTAEAIRNFQQANNLDVTGTLTIQTLTALGMGNVLQGQTGQQIGTAEDMREGAGAQQPGQAQSPTVQTPGQQPLQPGQATGQGGLGGGRLGGGQGTQ